MQLKQLKTAVTALVLAGCAVGVCAQAITKEQYKSSEASITTEYKTAKAACDAFSGNTRDICVAEAEGRRDVAKAELEASYKPGVKSRYDASVARADADYGVAMEKCDDKAGNDKDVCVKEA